METHPLAEVLSILPMVHPDLVVQHLVSATAGIELFARVAGDHARCPCCETRSAQVHGRYVRRLADLAWQGTPVRLHLQVRRFRCAAAACPRRTFAERTPTLAAPHARRTGRLAALLTRVGMALGGEAGARLLPTLGATASADTVLRLVHRAPTPTAPTPRVLGVDEWARRKGHTYGTVLVDLERHAPVDLLDDRSAESFARWLTAHPGVEVITRDRSEIYALGARLGAPHAVQVADRWHLLKNVGDVVERVLHRHRPALVEAARRVRSPRPGDAAPATMPAPSCGPRAQERYAQIQALHAAGRSIRAIVRELGLSRPTVRKYLRASSCPPRATRPTKIGVLTAFEHHLRARWREGCRSVARLWRELQALGFGGSYQAVRRHVAPWRQECAAPADEAPCGKTPSPRQARWWLLLPESRLSVEQRAYVAELMRASAALASTRTAAVEFGRVVREHDVAGWESWLERTRSSEVPEVRDFVAGLDRDRAAVRAAVEQTWSNGQSEGQVTRIKLLKRQMYGRASVALLRQRLLHAA